VHGRDTVRFEDGDGVGGWAFDIGNNGRHGGTPDLFDRHLRPAQNLPEWGFR
jgi:hypothetical protein